MGWRENFRDDNRLLLEFVSGWRGKAYLWIAAITFARQTVPRLQACEGLVGCGLSFVKCSIWSLLWPFYWLNYATDFVLFHLHGG